jgi:hypothetical protein
MAHVHRDEIRPYLCSRLEPTPTSTIESRFTSRPSCTDDPKVGKFLAQLAALRRAPWFAGVEARTNLALWDSLLRIAANAEAAVS